jgi:hypothetical protein
MKSADKEKKKSICWVIRWEGNQFAKDFVQILPRQWNPEEVEDYLIGLYCNSPTLLLSERLNKIKTMGSKKALRQGFVISESSRIVVGVNPFLAACKADDLEIVHQQDKDIEFLSYTEPPGYRFNRETGLREQVGSQTAG